LGFCHFFAREFPSFGVADFDTFATFYAGGPDCRKSLIHYFHSVVLAEGVAIPAADASIFPQNELLIGRNRFRVMAPLTAKWTSLKKDRRADTRSIIDREPLYVENQTFHISD
jgi:hypothetical protein